jgi:hypothetical protein
MAQHIRDAARGRRLDSFKFVLCPYGQMSALVAQLLLQLTLSGPAPHFLLDCAHDARAPGKAQTLLRRICLARRRRGGGGVSTRDENAYERAPAAAGRRVPKARLEDHPQIGGYDLPAEGRIDGNLESGGDQLARPEARKKVDVNSVPGALGGLNQLVVGLRPSVGIPPGDRRVAEKEETPQAFASGLTSGLEPGTVKFLPAGSDIKFSSPEGACCSIGGEGRD